MRECRFHRELYDGKAVDAAVKVFDGYAAFDLVEDNEYWVVRITGKSPARELKLARELGNYALGLTRRESALS